MKQQRALLSSLAQHAFELEIHPEQGQGPADANDRSLSRAKRLAHTATRTQEQCTMWFKKRHPTTGRQVQRKEVLPHRANDLV